MKEVEIVSHKAIGEEPYESHIVVISINKDGKEKKYKYDYIQHDDWKAFEKVFNSGGLGWAAVNKILKKYHCEEVRPNTPEEDKDIEAVLKKMREKFK